MHLDFSVLIVGALLWINLLIKPKDESTPSVRYYTVNSVTCSAAGEK